MTHADIYEKFLIEYDKDNVTSSYPSLTKKEAATILNKSYLALIAQKMTGNNIRKASFESDIKAIADLQPLIKTISIYLDDDYQSNKTSSNVVVGQLTADNLYFVSAVLENGQYTEPVQLLDHVSARKFFASSYNKPWIKTPICYLQNDKIYVVFDPVKYSIQSPETLYYTYIKIPTQFTSATISSSNIQFELNDSVAEELISLAITFALENVESQRLTSKLNTRGLEV